MHTSVSVTFLVLLALTQNSSAPHMPLHRRVQGQTLVSDEIPAAQFTFSKDYRYVGGQVVNLYGNADAEQHLFVKGASSGPIDSFYWVQFEHFLPSNNRTYDYPADRTSDFGDLRFIYDVKSFPDYDTMQAEDPQSDGAAIGKLLAQHNLSFPKKTARVRMFYLPTPDRRTELMIIYGEALAADSKVPVAPDGVALDASFPDTAKMLRRMSAFGSVSPFVLRIFIYPARLKCFEVTFCRQSTFSPPCERRLGSSADRWLR